MAPRTIRRADGKIVNKGLRSSAILTLRRKIDQQGFKLDRILKILSDNNAEANQRETTTQDPRPPTTEQRKPCKILPKRTSNNSISLASQLNPLSRDSLKFFRRLRSPKQSKPLYPRHNQSQSRLLQLPSELRNSIYELVLISANPIEDPSSQSAEKRNDNTKRIGDINSSLLMTCRMVLDEAKPILYGRNIFVFDAWGFAAWRDHTSLVTRAKFVIGRTTYGDRSEAIAVRAKGFTDCVFVEQDSTYPLPFHTLVPLLKELVLDFSAWELRKNERFPPTLLKRMKETPLKLAKLTLLGLRNHGHVRKELEEALVEKSTPQMALTEFEDQKQIFGASANALSVAPSPANLVNDINAYDLGQVTAAFPMSIDDLDWYNLESESDTNAVAGLSSSSSPVDLTRQLAQALQPTSPSVSFFSNRFGFLDHEPNKLQSSSGTSSKKISSKKRKTLEESDTSTISDTGRSSGSSKRIKICNNKEAIDLDSEESDDSREKITAAETTRKRSANTPFLSLPQNILAKKRNRLSNLTQDTPTIDELLVEQASPPSTSTGDCASRMNGLQPLLNDWKQRSQRDEQKKTIGKGKKVEK